MRLGSKKEPKVDEAVTGAEVIPASTGYEMERHLGDEDGRGYHEPLGSGLETPRQLDQYTVDRLIQLLYHPKDDELATVTVTPREQFNQIVIGDTFDIVTKLGDRRTESIWRIFLKLRDRRAPSVTTDVGEGSRSRDALISLHNARATPEQEGGYGRMSFGGED